MAKRIENVIYILTNPQYPGYVKIGYASDLKQRIFTLNTGALVEFSPYAVYETNRQNADVEIHAIIKLLNPILRASKFDNGKAKGKEFFKLEPEEAFELLQHIAMVSGTETRVYRVTPDYQPIRPVEELLPPEVDIIKTPPVILNKKNVVPDGTYHMEGHMQHHGSMLVKATADVRDEMWIVKAGSIICPENGKGLNLGGIEARKNAKVVDNVLQEDMTFKSGSGAAVLVTGCSTSGWDWWRTEDGESIKKFKK